MRASAEKFLQDLSFEAASLGVPRPRLIAACKGRSAAEVKAAFLAGIKDFGVNTMQHGRALRRGLKELGPECEAGIRWHFIGRLQTNKLKAVGPNYEVLHSVFREDHLDALAALSESRGLRLEFMLQVNIDSEPSKGGLLFDGQSAAAKRCYALAKKYCAAGSSLLPRGLMCLPKPQAKASLCQSLASMQKLLKATSDLLAKDGYPSFDQLSMGTSSDWRLALAAGATQIRVGRQIFGERAPPTQLGN